MADIEYHFDITSLNNANQRQLIRLIVAIFIFTGVSVISLAYFTGYANKNLITIELLTMALQLLGLKLASRDKSLLIAARTIIYSSLVGRLFFVFSTTGLLSPMLLILPIYPMLAIVLLQKKEYLLILLLLTFGTAGIGFLHITGHSFLAGPSLLFQTVTIITALAMISIFVAAIFKYSMRLNGQLSEKILDMASHDYLTEVLNRRAIDSALENEMQRAKRDKTWISILMIDVDFFKLYNDQHGHLKGDSCLQTIADTIKSNLRNPPDSIGRYGGEEFLLILPNTDSESALNVAERIRQSIKEQNLRFGINGSKNLTVTIGIVTSKLIPDDTAELLVNIADKCLYKGKAEGRDQLVHMERACNEDGKPNIQTLPNSNLAS